MIISADSTTGEVVERKGCAGNSSATIMEAANRRSFVIISADSTTDGVVEAPSLWVEGKPFARISSATTMRGGEQETFCDNIS